VTDLLQIIPNLHMYILNADIDAASRSLSLRTISNVRIVAHPGQKFARCKSY
jgi:hypothetical protein